MRRLLKFLHSVGAAGLMGAAAALAVVLIVAQAAPEASGQIVVPMARVAAWVIGPSILLTVFTGLLAMVVHPPFQDAGWVWAKAATGILVLQAGLHVMGPMQAQANRAAPPDGSAPHFAAEINTLWLLLAVSVANIALGVWRPRLPKSPA